MSPQAADPRDVVSRSPSIALPPIRAREAFDDPKSLYRLFDEVLARQASEADPQRDLQGSLEVCFPTLARDLGVQGMVLYRACSNAFREVRRFGEVAGSVARAFPAERAVLQLLQEAHTCTWPDATGAPAPVFLSLPARLPAALVTLGSSQVTHIVLFLLSDGLDADLVRTVLGTVRAVLGARMLQSRWGNALRLAAEIQDGLLPAAPPPLEGYEIAARSAPAEEVGGDFFDFLPIDERTLGVVIGDASGHGLPAALVARDALMGLRMGVEREMKASHVLSRLNRILHRSGPASSFVSAFYGELEQSGNLFYVNAGHVPPLCVRNGSASFLAVGDCVLGPVPDATFRRHYAYLPRGSVTILYTDGITERQDAHRNLFSMESLVSTVLGSARLPAERVLENVLHAAEAHGGGAPWEDDATIVVVRRLP